MTDSQRDAVTGVFVNVGKAIAAYERRIEFGPSRFDRYVDAISDTGGGDGILTSDEIAGLKLFIGKANCTQCHNGPLFANNELHNTGVPRRAELPSDEGRLTGASTVLKDEFNCRSRWSDAPPEMRGAGVLGDRRSHAGAGLQSAVAAQRRQTRTIHGCRSVRDTR